jgi:hypothetical protein
MDKKDLDYLFRIYFSDLDPILKEFLSYKEYQFISSHFKKDAITSHKKFISFVFPIGNTERGKQFLVQISLRATFYKGNKIILRWTPSLIKNRHDYLTVDLVSPIMASSKDGYKLELDRFETIITLKFVSYCSGRIDLGMVNILSPSGQIEIKINLGKIDVSENFEAAFYHPPFEKYYYTFESLLKKTLNGACEAISIIGFGGAGKSRLCFYYCEVAEKKDFRSISLEHPTNYYQPYKVLGDILRLLVPTPLTSDTDDYSIVTNRLEKINQELFTEAIGALEIIYGKAQVRNIENDNGLNQEAIIRTILSFILCQSEIKPICIHISNLHWANSETLSIFEEVTERLKNIANILRKGYIPDPGQILPRVIFIFEGRHFEGGGKGKEGYNTVLFEHFSHKISSKCIHVEPFTEKESLGFLNHLFESSQSSSRKVDSKLILFQSNLIGHIMQYSKGNPFHMLEQIKMLIGQKIIQINERTGLLFLAKAIRKQYDSPIDVKRLIRDRLKYLGKKNEQIVSFIRALAIIKDRIDYRLFETFQTKLFPEITKADLINTGFLEFPVQNYGEVSFKHENYYHVVKDIPLNNKEKLITVYLDWLDKKSDRGLADLFEEALLYQQSEKYDRNTVMKKILLVFESYKARGDHQMVIQSLEFILRLYPFGQKKIKARNSDDLQQYFGYLFLLAKFNSWVGDWIEVKTIYENNISIAESYLTKLKNEYTDEIYYTYSCCIVELSNAEHHLFMPYSAIDRLIELLNEINLRYDETTTEQWRDLLIRAKNRLAICYWFEGDYSKAANILKETLSICRILGDPVLVSDQLRDLGTLKLHENLKESKNMITKSLSELKGMSVVSRKPILLQAHLYMVELILLNHSESPSKNDYSVLLKKIKEQYALAEKENYPNEKSFCSLLAGVCFALTDKQEFNYWFRNCVSIAQSNHLIEHLWKAQLNMAQHCMTLSIPNSEGAAHYAQQAQRIIENDLRKRHQTRSYQQRVNFYTLAFYQLARIWHNIGDGRSMALYRDYPKIKKIMASGPPAFNKVKDSFPVYALDKGNTYFLIN